MVPNNLGNMKSERSCGGSAWDMAPAGRRGEEDEHEPILSLAGRSVSARTRQARVTDSHRLRFVVCDDEHQYSSLVERLLGELGHEVVGVATTAADASALIGAAQPDVVILDLSTDFNSDFDVVAAAATVGVAVVIFSQRVDEARLRRYEVHPTVVYKPDLVELERVIRQLVVELREAPRSDHADEKSEDRRSRPTRELVGAEPTSVTDSPAFYEALNGAAEGDALLSIELGELGGPEALAELTARVKTVMRETDRILMSHTYVRVFLLAGGADGVASFFSRAQAKNMLSDGAAVRVVLIAAGESPMDAFDRLKTTLPSPIPPGSD